MTARTAWIAAALLVLAAAAVAAAVEWRRQARADDNLRQRVAQRVVAGAGTRIDCATLLQQRPVVLLVLGQSNAGNHGTAAGPGAAVTVIGDDGACHRSSDPLPGATGTGASIWSRLPAALAAAGVERPVVFAVLAVDASSVHEWTHPRSPLPPLLKATAQRAIGLGLAPTLVLWQQGESDARLGTAADTYRQGLSTLAADLQAAGVAAPVVLARSTVCRNAPSEPLRAAIGQLVTSDSRFRLGPDTDDLVGPADRSDGCHFGDSGLQAAAERWARSIAPLLR